MTIFADRVSLLARGPGILAVVIGAALAGTALHRSHGVAATTAAPTATLAPPPFHATVSGQHVASDPASGLQVWARDVRVVGAGQSTKARAALAVELQIWNGSSAARQFDSSSFYLVATRGAVPPGTTIAPGTPGGLTPLASGRLPAGAMRTGWVAFDLPRSQSVYVLIWTDDDRLLSPATVATVTVTRSGGGAL